MKEIRCGGPSREARAAAGGGEKRTLERQREGLFFRRQAPLDTLFCPACRRACVILPAFPLRRYSMIERDRERAIALWREHNDDD
ncbi:MAG TPA: hypothetical protein PKW82_09880, partial [Spirochaetales bacterium]|nr:hypothetical protein [Spirochaetales bacterium]